MSVAPATTAPTSAPPRYGDAFSDAVDLALNSPNLPMQAGERAHVMVAVSLKDLKSGVGKATLGDTGTMTAAEARVHACDAMIIPAVLGEKSEPLNLGRLRRLISAGLRRALFLRDRGCAFPGCHRPPRHCQGHHIRHVRHEARVYPIGGARPPTLDRHSGSVKLRAA
nr:HNH endonuclease signature motif containing protein [Amycolatopsis tolypomycina]